MLLVFRQHRLASSATGGASVMLHTSSSSGAFACECAELPIESRELSTVARRCGVTGDSPVLLFFCRRFLFQIKRKCRNAGRSYRSIMAGRKGRSPLSPHHEQDFFNKKKMPKRGKIISFDYARSRTQKPAIADLNSMQSRSIFPVLQILLPSR